MELAESSEALPKAFGVQGLEESNVAEKVLAAKDRWTRQFWRSMDTLYNEVNEEPRFREQTHKWNEPGNPTRQYETLTLFVFVDPGTDCTAAFCGDLWGECTGALETTDMPECGLTGVYKCYLRQTMTLLQDALWKKASDILASPECKGGVQATGWGEGGTQAGIFAACANNAKNGTIVLNGTEVKLPTVTSLLTFGARPVGDGEQPTNGQSPDGVFQGVRIWFEHEGAGPNVAEVDGCAWGWRGVSKPVAVHPKMWAMSARMTWAVSWEASLYKPTSETAKRGNTSYQRTGPCGGALSKSYHELKWIGSAKMGN